MSSKKPGLCVKQKLMQQLSTRFFYETKEKQVTENITPQRCFNSEQQQTAQGRKELKRKT